LLIAARKSQKRLCSIGFSAHFTINGRASGCSTVVEQSAMILSWRILIKALVAPGREKKKKDRHEIGKDLEQHFTLIQVSLRSVLVRLYNFCDNERFQNKSDTSGRALLQTERDCISGPVCNRFGKVCMQHQNNVCLH
jgi:hypothetical protein